jgi:hypothetical protein
VIIAVEGTKSFNDYEVFMRAMGVALSSLNSDSDIQVWSLGPHKINSFTAAFCNSSENFLKQKGFRITFSKVNTSWMIENISHVNYFAYFSLPKENTSKLVKLAQEIEGCEVGIFRY